MYFGPAKDMISYFECIGYVCPEHMNPADYFRTCHLPTTHSRCLTHCCVVPVVDLITVDVRTQVDEKESRGRLEGLVAAFDESSHCGAIEQDLMGEMMGEEGPEEGESNHSPRESETQSLLGKKKKQKAKKGTGKSLKAKIEDQRISYFFQMLILFVRSLQNTLRDKTIILVRIPLPFLLLYLFFKLDN